MELDFDQLPEGCEYAENVGSGTISIIDPSRLPSTFIGTEFIIIERPKAEPKVEVKVEPEAEPKVELKVNKKKTKV